MANKRPYFKFFRDYATTGVLQIPNAEFKVLMCLKCHENATTRLCCPSYTTIEAETRLSRATVAKTVKWLEVHGYISKHPQALKRGRTYNQYQILL